MRNAIKCGLAALVCLSASLPVRAAVTAEQAESAFKAFNKAYWNATDKYFYKRDGKSGVLDFWLSAHAWETVMDVYQLTGKDEYKQQIKDVYDGFVKRNGTDWTQNDYNDDIMWWTIATARAYSLTGDTRYLNQSKTHFDWVWKTQRDSVLGGVWWKNSEHKSKNSCVVQPAIITATFLAKALNDDGYRVKAESLYAWQKRTLMDPRNPGKIFDAINVSGTLGTGSTTYNQGTFIGSAVGLGHMADAKVCADWTKKNMCTTAGVVREANQGDFAAFKLILVRYAMGMARQLGTTAGAPYEAWMDVNATSVWGKRRAADDIMGPDWNNAAPATGIESASAASGVTLLVLLATPASTAISPMARSLRSQRVSFVFPGVAGSGPATPAILLPGGWRGMDGRLQASTPPGSFSRLP